MKSIDVFDKFNSDLSGTVVNKFFWLAICGEGTAMREVESFIREIGSDQFLELFPDFDLSIQEEINDQYDTFFYNFIDKRRLGFIAELWIPIFSCFTFDEETGLPSTYSSGGAYGAHYLYAETLEEFVSKCESIFEAEFSKQVEVGKSKLNFNEQIKA